jgi:uncharacterized protein YqgV (UPF0045/DUF77 family)
MQCHRLPEAHLSGYLQPTTRLYQETHTVKLTAELSLYPLQEDYIPVIQAFINAARADNDLVIVTNAMSTQVCGDYDQVFSMIQQALKTSYQQYGKQVLVCKFIPGELDIQ